MICPVDFNCPVPCRLIGCLPKSGTVIGQLLERQDPIFRIKLDPFWTGVTSENVAILILSCLEAV